MGGRSFEGLRREGGLVIVGGSAAAGWEGVSCRSVGRELGVHSGVCYASLFIFEMSRE